MFYDNDAEKPRHILALASAIYVIDSKFYFNYFFDARGRIYSTQQYLSFFQGDLSRSLLALPEEEGEYLLNELLMYGRRFFPTLREKSENYSLTYIKENLDKFIEDLSNFLWTKKKNSFQYFAWLLEVQSCLA